MTPLRDNLDRAKAEYGRHRYRGSLADDVLGTRHATRSDARRQAGAIAIAATLAVGLGAYIVATRSTTVPSDRVVAIATRPAAPDHLASATVEPAVAPTNVVASTEAVAMDEEDEIDFTLVPTAATLVGEEASLAGEYASVVPSLASVAGAGDFSLSVPGSPMLFSLGSLIEADQPASIDQADSPSDIFSEERS